MIMDAKQKFQSLLAELGQQKRKAETSAGDLYSETVRKALHGEFPKAPDLQRIAAAAGKTLAQFEADLSAGLERLQKVDQLIALGDVDAEHAAAIEAVAHWQKVLREANESLPKAAERVSTLVGKRHTRHLLEEELAKTCPDPKLNAEYDVLQRAFKAAQSTLGAKRAQLEHLRQAFMDARDRLGYKNTTWPEEERSRMQSIFATAPAEISALEREVPRLEDEVAKMKKQRMALIRCMASVK